MSAVMYNYRVQKSLFWEAMDEVRKFYRENGLLGTLLKRRDEAWLATYEQGSQPDFTNVNKTEEALRMWFKTHSVKIQVFDLGRDYILRVLEPGYEFYNNHERFVNLRPCFYDDRTDSNPNTRRNLRVLDRVDEMISKHQYLLYPIYDADSIFDMYYMRLPEKKRDDTTQTPTATA